MHQLKEIISLGVGGGASLVVQMVKNLPARQETWRSLCQEEPLEEEMAAHSRILAWRIPWTEETGRLQALGLQRVWHGWATNTTHYFLKILCSKATNHTITQMKTYTVLFLVCKALFSLLCSPIFCPCFKAQLKTHLSWKLSHHSLANASFLSWFIAWSICCLSHPLAHAILVAI